MIRLVLAYDVRVCVCVCVCRVSWACRVCCVHFSESSLSRGPGALPLPRWLVVRYIYLLPTTNGWALASCFDLSGSVGARPPPLEGGVGSTRASLSEWNLSLSKSCPSSQELLPTCQEVSVG